MFDVLFTSLLNPPSARSATQKPTSRLQGSARVDEGAGEDEEIPLIGQHDRPLGMQGSEDQSGKTVTFRRVPVSHAAVLYSALQHCTVQHCLQQGRYSQRNLNLNWSLSTLFGLECRIPWIQRRPSTPKGCHQTARLNHLSRLFFAFPLFAVQITAHVFIF